jgi:hypothetical protein
MVTLGLGRRGSKVGLVVHIIACVGQDIRRWTEWSTSSIRILEQEIVGESACWASEHSV